MLTLDDIATELLIIIATSLSPKDAFNLAVASKSTWQRCSRVIEEHQHFSIRYSRLFDEECDFGPPGCPPYHMDGTEPKSAWAMFQAICNDPRIAYHVRNVQKPEYYWDDVDVTEREEQLRLCREAATGSTAINGIDASTLDEAINSQAPINLFFILLQMCPNVKMLRFKDDDDDETNVYDRFFQGLLYGTGTVRPGTLQMLENAIVEHWDTELSISIDYLQDLILIPTMRTLTGRLVGSSTVTKPLRLPVSNLTDLVLEESHVTVESLEFLVSQIKALERFEYTDGGAIIGDENEDLCGIVSVLAEHHGHSLLRLVVDAGNSMWPEEDQDPLTPFPGFKGFAKLKSLSIEVRMFAVRTSDEGDYMRPLDESIKLGDALPETLQDFTLTCAEFESSDPIEVITANLVQAKETYTPHLQEITIPIIHVSHADAAVLAARREGRKQLEAACKAHSVKSNIPISPDEIGLAASSDQAGISASN